ncbi:unnamed protein product [Phytomonas sp. EM1]|nr:unnamed protein product [Phytomonas sp. EM1]|eukprot:CCW59732.1 unnamed protein product [Phytomonas sp. isolate EM1]
MSATRLLEFDAQGQAVSATGTTNTFQGFQQSTATSSPQLPGKSKYIIEYGVLTMYDANNSTGSHGMLFLFCELETDKIVFSYREGATGNVYARSFTDEELEIEKNASGVAFSWAPFFKSVAAALIKSTAVVSATTETQKDVSFTICNSKDTSRSYPFKVTMGLVSNGRSPSMEVVFRYVLRPLSRGLQYYRRMDNKRMLQTQRIECETVINKASLDRLKKDADRLLSVIHPLCEDLASSVYESMKLSNELRRCEDQVRELRGKNGVKKHPLDALYDDGGPQRFQHISWSVQHYPYEAEVNDILLDCIRAALPLPPGETLDSISRVFELPDIKQRIESSGNRQTIVEAFEVFKGIDQWGCDTIGLEILTEGNSLFYIVYILMYKLDLVSHFSIDDQVLRNFLAAVQAGYHANPYHNAMHAADVTQINYYIMMVAGLCDKCCLTRIEIFAGLISGAIHDFDHPGLNNNFHARTNAHLATLYNDRSILENHHVACIFELLRNPRYDILATLDEQQKMDFRTVVLEMVLATDMGNHAKIFKKFQLRVSEPEDWHSKKDDVMLALCMSIKMADVSNCARPSHIYAVWARNIANEFYLQGDAERSLDLPITPFMDRTKDKGEFVKGQIAFIMFIVRPLVEAISELLPSLSFMVGFCSENMHLLKTRNERSQI